MPLRLISAPSQVNAIFSSARKVDVIVGVHWYHNRVLSELCLSCTDLRDISIICCFKVFRLKLSVAVSVFPQEILSCYAVGLVILHENYSTGLRQTYLNVSWQRTQYAHSWFPLAYPSIRHLHLYLFVNQTIYISKKQELIGNWSIGWSIPRQQYGMNHFLSQITCWVGVHARWPLRLSCVSVRKWPLLPLSSCALQCTAICAIHTRGDPRVSPTSSFAIVPPAQEYLHKST